MSHRQQVVVLGSTGSIGTSTLDVIRHQRSSFEVFALSASTSVATMRAQCLEFQPRFAVMADEKAAQSLSDQLPTECTTEVLHGALALEGIVADAQVDVVLAAIVGSAGLPATLAAARAGKKILLANKEALVMAGHLFMDAVRDSGAVLLPIDSEHNAIFQCLPVNDRARAGLDGVTGILLTASGGPFRTWTSPQIAAATVEQACAHPNWSMGRKISVDSASLMNKGLELIEACWLFDVSQEQIEVVVHPQSIIHSLVQYVDGSVLAQLGNPDMRTPIAYGLGWPDRMDSGVAPLDLVAIGQLSFEAPDEGRFPCLRLAREASAVGGTAMAVCNAANEVAVAAFLEEAIGFGDIPRVIESALGLANIVEPRNLTVVEEADAIARELATEAIAKLSCAPVEFRRS